ncbi:hypothetical protein [Herbaspirillum sp. YR522]|uniref:hypothetical protein n=1 Tax=Herbaspirillum sp. YR522 TaxID=1144342 RepID=UPI00026F5CBF|nr:hypothetical protein [Herbaspirillum sp. YR522]EJN01748.1 hypothetical protein PMI40_03235 [Herbaspirillum sp. YR522]
MHRSRIKIYKGIQIEVTVTRFDQEFCSFTNVRPYGLDTGAAAVSIFAEWIDQKAMTPKIAFDNAFSRALIAIAKRDARRHHDQRLSP